MLRELVEQDLTVRQIAERVGTSPASAARWLKRHDLETTAAARRSGKRGAAQRRFVARCKVHGTTTFVVRNDGGSACLRCRARRVIARRRRLKEILVAEAGGRCVLCGYSRCVAALEFHHVDPASKRFSLASRGLTRALDTLREEAAKCLLLCSNCHAEVEAGVATVPGSAAEFPGGVTGAG